MAIRIVGGIDPNVVQGAAPNTAVASSLVQGLFVGLNSSGELVPADFRASEDAPAALGALIMGAQQKNAQGGVMFIHPQLGYCPNDGIRIDGFTGLTPGTRYYLSSGGGITATKPAGTTGDIDQEVGTAESATLLIMHLGPASYHA